jgi:hypothetical protein
LGIRGTKLNNMLTKQSVKNYLQKEGFTPKELDSGFAFKYQFKFFIIELDIKDPNYLRIIMPNIYNVSLNLDIKKVFKACNEATKSTKVAKVFMIDDNDVWATYEIIVDSTPELDDLIPRGLNILLAAHENFYKNI